ncbi:hypothetical protein [Sphingomonas sp. BAUL-RG-20F-R05-02]|uniref:hypothetical protein n=1 Tax=Sphingomonas sp. BAUL-RG-20F-R05-02 TaxID=2914830 RepID=UPI001F598949|nr:hypothetical protein [Sphingomonas sp. BAUL-RG-20F-R05-02]
MNRHFTLTLASPATIARRERAPADLPGSALRRVGTVRHTVTAFPAPVRGVVRDRHCSAYRINIAARTIAGSFGAYAVVAALGALLARLLPMARPEAVMTGMLAALLVFPAVTIWAFLARSPARALGGIATAAFALATLALTLPLPA